jgi:hypothetical protein
VWPCWPGPTQDATPVAAPAAQVGAVTRTLRLTGSGLACSSQARPPPLRGAASPIEAGTHQAGVAPVSGRPWSDPCAGRRATAVRPRPRRPTARTPGFQSGNTGSIPVGGMGLAARAAPSVRDSSRAERRPVKPLVPGSSPGLGVSDAGMPASLHRWQSGSMRGTANPVGVTPIIGSNPIRCSPGGSSVGRAPDCGSGDRGSTPRLLTPGWIAETLMPPGASAPGFLPSGPSADSP